MLISNQITLKNHSALVFNFNRYQAFIFILIFLNLNAFYLFDASTTRITDIALVVGLMFYLYVFARHKGIFFKGNTISILLFFVPLLIFMSAYMATLTYNQPLWLGLRPQRHWFTWIIIYYPIYLLLITGRISRQEIINTLYYSGILYLALCTIQSLLGHSISILHVKTNLRYDSARFYFESVYLMLLLGFSLDKLLNHFNIRRFIIPLWILGFVIFINKGRMLLISVVASVILCLIIHKGKVIHKFIYIVLGILLIIAVLNSQIGQDTLQTILEINRGSSSGSNRVSSLDIREYGREYYLMHLMESLPTFIFGYGYANTDWYASTLISGMTQGIAWVDNGIFGIFFYYGLIGVLWWIIIMGVTFSYAVKIYKRNGSTVYLFYIFVILFGSITLPPDTFKPYLTYSIFLVLITYDYGILTKRKSAQE